MVSSMGRTQSWAKNRANEVTTVEDYATESLPTKTDFGIANLDPRLLAVEECEQVRNAIGV